MQCIIWGSFGAGETVETLVRTDVASWYNESEM